MIEGKQDDEAEHEWPDSSARTQARAGEGGATPSPSRAAWTSAPPMPPAATDADAVEPDAPVGVRHLAQEHEREDDRGKAERQRPAPGQHEFVVDVGLARDS